MLEPGLEMAVVSYQARRITFADGMDHRIDTGIENLLDGIEEFLNRSTGPGSHIGDMGRCAIKHFDRFYVSRR